MGLQRPWSGESLWSPLNMPCFNATKAAFWKLMLAHRQGSNKTIINVYVFNTHPCIVYVIYVNIYIYTLIIYIHGLLDARRILVYSVRRQSCCTALARNASQWCPLRMLAAAGDATSCKSPSSCMSQSSTSLKFSRDLNSMNTFIEQNCLLHRL